MINTSAYYKRNNLDKSYSPYLLQHAGNPVWWQEWSKEVLELAMKENKPLLVSSGYSTCHWCHVMAAGAFSDPDTSAFLNDHFVCIKIDREQRPDIDQFMMDFTQEQNGNGGWPLNVFLTPDARPFFALTYAPAVPDGDRMSFLNIMQKLLEYFEKHGNNVLPYRTFEKKPLIAAEETLIRDLVSYYDDIYGGFGSGQKFPPHTTLLFLLYCLADKEDAVTRAICTETLDAIRLRGLNDHLQGGIFRYCTDREWTIPHFEKMLYDQAMALWCYSLAYKILGKGEYKKMAGKILLCLEECFEEDGLYVTAFNADTDHEEGATYLWSYDELSDALTPDEFRRFTEVYSITGEGNFEGKNHLLRRNDHLLDNIEAKLMSIRKTRKQPFRDNKILCGINALVAVSLIQAGRFLDQPGLEVKAASVVRQLTVIFLNGSTLGHSWYSGVLQKQRFLSDAGALLTAITMLFETDATWGDLMTTMTRYVGSFREEGQWIESKADDFHTVYASWFDHPVPSGAALAEMALTRVAVLTGKEYPPAAYRQPFLSDFYNVNALISNGMFHIITSEKSIPWSLLPANSLQKRGIPETQCYKNICRILDPEYPGLV